MEKLTFTLKQHTPMLHFQASQQGATLRASDVKPRFDRWLVQTAFNGKFEDCKEYLVGYDPKKPNELRDKFNAGFRALNYKMRIVSERKGNIIPFSEFLGTDNPGKKKKQQNAPMYFGDKSGRTVELLNNTGSITLTINCFHDVLAEKIKENISEFFLKHNFGTRSSKGYGAFTVGNDMAVSRLYYDVEAKTYLDVLNEIDLIYKTMRSGINFGGVYFKSLMFSYAKSKNLRWDKKSIKESLLLPAEMENQSGKWRNPDVLTFRNGECDRADFRDAMGLSTNEKWCFYGMEVSKKKSSIDRFASPILCKPVKFPSSNKWRVHIFWSELPEEIYDKPISVNVAVDAKNRSNASGKVNPAFLYGPKELFKMKIPAQFKMSDYMDYIFKAKDGRYQVLIADQFSSGCRNRDISLKIQKIYDQLRKNYNK